MTSARLLLRPAFLLFFGVPFASVAVWAGPTASPFLPPGQAPVAVTENTPVEFRGVLTTPSGKLFGLFDPAKKISAWVKANEAGGDFHVKNFDASNESLTVEYQGRTLTLKLQTAKIAALPQGAPPPMVAPIPNQGMPQPPVVLNPTPADEARRLESVAAEVRRRRALRQAAAQQQQQPQPGMPGEPPPQPAPGAPRSP